MFFATWATQQRNDNGGTYSNSWVKSGLTPIYGGNETNIKRPFFSPNERLKHQLLP